jgi:hypothetical protein
MQRRSQCVPQSEDRRTGSLQVIDPDKVMNRPEQPHRSHCDTRFGKSICVQFAVVRNTSHSVRYNHRWRNPRKTVTHPDAI